MDRIKEDDLDDKRVAFTRWVEAKEDRAIPNAEWLPGWGDPLYARETISRPVQPYADQYDALYRKIGKSLTLDDYGHWEHPHPKWWKPTKKMAKRLRRLQELRALKSETIPNPDYDPVRADEWKKTRTPPYSATQIMTGQSYRPDLNDFEPAPTFNTALPAASE